MICDSHFNTGTPNSHQPWEEATIFFYESKTLQSFRCKKALPDNQNPQDGFLWTYLLSYMSGFSYRKIIANYESLWHWLISNVKLGKTERWWFYVCPSRNSLFYEWSGYQVPLISAYAELPISGKQNICLSPAKPRPAYSSKFPYQNIEDPKKLKPQNPIPPTPVL